MARPPAWGWLLIMYTSHYGHWGRPSELLLISRSKLSWTVIYHWGPCCPLPPLVSSFCARHSSGMIIFFAAKSIQTIMAMVMWIDPWICVPSHPLILYLFCCDDHVKACTGRRVSCDYAALCTSEHSMISWFSTHALEDNFISLFRLMAAYGGKRFRRTRMARSGS